MTEREPEYGKSTKRTVPVYCHARWFSDGMIHACREKVVPKHLRCEKHGPDGCRLDKSGQPMRNVPVRRRSVRR